MHAVPVADFTFGIIMLSWESMTPHSYRFIYMFIYIHAFKFLGACQEVSTALYFVYSGNTIV